MKIGIIGSGNMGGSLGKLWARAGHEVVFSFSKDANKLDRLAAAAGGNARAGTVAEAVRESDVIMLSMRSMKFCRTATVLQTKQSFPASAD